MIRRMNELVSLPALDYGRAVSFYRDVLGFPVLFDENDFAIFDTGGCQLGVHRKEGGGPIDPDGVWIWLEVEDIESVRGALAARGARLVGEKEFIGPGWQQLFLDSEGNTLRLYQPLEEVHRSVWIEAPPSAVFELLTDPAEVEEWFAAIDDVAIEARVGGRISFVDPAFGRVEGVVEELVPAERIRFAFEANWPRALEFTLSAESGGTRLEVRQTGFDAIRDRDYGIGALVEAVEAAVAALLKRAARVKPA